MGWCIVCRITRHIVVMRAQQDALLGVESMLVATGNAQHLTHVGLVRVSVYSVDTLTPA